MSLALLAIPGVNTWVLASWQHAVGFGFFAGGIATGSLRGALFGGISAAAFYATGTHFSAVTGLPAGGIGQTLAHGVTGGILAELQGGQFGHGFISAGLTKAVLGRLRYRDGSAGAVLSRTTLAAMVGGTVSRITGGKFANGALAAALVYLANNAAQKARALNQAFEFTISDKDFIVKGGTLAEKLQVQADLIEIFATLRGAEMLAQLESRQLLWFFREDFVIDLTVTNNAYAYLGGDAIYVDPNFHPTIQSTAGLIKATTQRIMAHEFGHAVFGTADDGPARMNNILQNENPIMDALGQPIRTRY